MYHNVSCMPVVTITIKHYNALDPGFTVCGLCWFMCKSQHEVCVLS